MVKLRAGGLNLDKNELLYTNSQEFFPDFRNISFSEHHLNECFCSGFIFRLQCISPASNAKSNATVRKVLPIKKSFLGN